MGLLGMNGIGPNKMMASCVLPLRRTRVQKSNLCAPGCAAPGHHIACHEAGGQATARGCPASRVLGLLRTAGRGRQREQRVPVPASCICGGLGQLESKEALMCCGKKRVSFFQTQVKAASFARSAPRVIKQAHLTYVTRRARPRIQLSACLGFALTSLPADSAQMQNGPMAPLLTCASAFVACRSAVRLAASASIASSRSFTSWRTARMLPSHVSRSDVHLDASARRAP